jgi:manganese transport protein
MKSIFSKVGHHPVFGGLEILKYIGPGLLVTVGFIDPGNWATNIAGGSEYGYALLWVVTLSTIMLIILQHNVAHLGIATGLCLSEAATLHLRPAVSRTILGTAMIASISTSLAEILGAAIALQMLFGLPLKIGAVLSAGFVLFLLLTNSYLKIERWVIGFVSIIGISFIYELSLVHVEWGRAAACAVVPQLPQGSLLVVLGVLGAVVMPHNLFLHSEIIQSRQYHKEGDEAIQKRLKYEFFDTLFSMIVGWAINSAMFILAAATFFKAGRHVDELQQAHEIMIPLLGPSASDIFAAALLMAGIASSVTSGMAAGSISAGLFAEPYDIKDTHSRMGAIVSIVGATLVIFFISNPFKGLIVSQMLLSVQLPITVLTQVYLTSSSKVMGKYVNAKGTTILISVIAAVVIALNLALLLQMTGLVDL